DIDEGKDDWPRVIGCRAIIRLAVARTERLRLLHEHGVATIPIAVVVADRRTLLVCSDGDQVLPRPRVDLEGVETRVPGVSADVLQSDRAGRDAVRARIRRFH